MPSNENLQYFPQAIALKYTNQIAKFFHQTRVDLNQDKAIKALSEFDESQILNQYYNILMS